MTDLTDPPTWDHAATLARAAATLMTDADLTHDLLVELAAPIVRRLAGMVEILETDPHGDGDEDQKGPPPAAWVASAVHNEKRAKDAEKALDAAHAELERISSVLAEALGEDPSPSDPRTAEQWAAMAAERIESSTKADEWTRLP